MRITGGSITANRNSKARRSLKCTVALTAWQDIPKFNVVTSRVQVWMGYDISGKAPVLIPVGVFRVDELARGADGTMEITGTSLESYVIENRFLSERQALAGTVCLTEIQRLIQECFLHEPAGPDGFPPSLFDITPWAASQAGVTLTNTLSPTTDRWDLIESLAFAIDCDVYCAPDGRFRIAQRPKMTALGKPVWAVNSGPDGVLVEISTTVSRDDMYNGVLVISGSTARADTPPESGYALWSNPSDPNDPKRWDGPMGNKLMEPVTAGIPLTKAQCEEEAAILLTEALAEGRSLNLSAIPNPALEPADLIAITMQDGTIENHLVTDMSIPLGLGLWTANTLSNKNVESLDPESPVKPAPPPDTPDSGGGDGDTGGGGGGGEDTGPATYASAKAALGATDLYANARGRWSIYAGSGK
jgi:hypothetical protein